MPPEWRTVLDVVNFIMGVAAIVLAAVAIIITIFFYRFSQTHEASASQAMGKIEENTRILSEIISKVLTQMTRRLAERPPSESPDFLLQVLQVVRPLTQAVPQINPQEVVTIPIQARIFICTGYYAALANLGLQTLPIADLDNPTDQERYLLQMLTLTKLDCQTVVNLLGLPPYATAIPETTLQEWYRTMLSWQPALRSEAEHRAHLSGA